MTIKGVLQDATNAVLDLQQADYNTYERPLKKLAKALNAPELEEVNGLLKSGVDFDKFVDESDRGGSMLGSAKLEWPDDPEKELGLTLILIERGAADPDWFRNFGHHWYYGGNKIIGDIRKLTTSVIVPFLRDYREYLEAKKPVAIARTPPSDREKVFIVHGHDDAARETVARFIATVGLEPIILHERASKGMTIPEKLIAYSNVGFAVVLLTPDDVGRAKAETDEKPRARQNVILELGYFVGLLGRDRVCGLKKGVLDIPSDYLGVVYVDFDNAGAWKQKLAQELEAADYEIDWNRVMRGS